MELDQASRRRSLLSCVRDEALWRYELDGRTHDSCQCSVLRIVETLGGEPLGYLRHPARLWRKSLSLGAYELKPGVSWLAVTPSVLRYLQAKGSALASEDENSSFETFFLRLGREHPAYTVVEDVLPRKRDPYAWYLRVPNLPAFLRTIAPVLERRLAESVAVGHSGELTVGFYGDGLRLVF